MLSCCAGGIAVIAGWMLGDQMFFQRASASLTDSAAPAEYPAPNTTAKNDRLPVSAIPAETAAPTSSNLSYDTALAYLSAPPPRMPELPKAEKPSRLFLNDAQIAGIKKRLNLSAAQQKYWQPVETALREVMLQLEDFQKRAKKSSGETFDADSGPVTRLKASSKALMAQLRGEQKTEIMMLARMAGLSSVVSEVTGGKAIAKNEPENSR